MTPKPDADLEFLSRPKETPPHRSARLLGRLMTLVALSGLALTAYSGRSGPNPSRFDVRNLMPGQGTPGFFRQSQMPSYVDPSVIVARPGIDEAMIVTARAGIDEAMIVQPSRIRAGALASPPILPPAAIGRAPQGSWPMVPQAPPPR